jgi:hypothetical protein
VNVFMLPDLLFRHDLFKNLDIGKNNKYISTASFF